MWNEKKEDEVEIMPRNKLQETFDKHIKLFLLDQIDRLDRLTNDHPFITALIWLFPKMTIKYEGRHFGNSESQLFAGNNAKLFLESLWREKQDIEIDANVTKIVNAIRYMKVERAPLVLLFISLFDIINVV